MKTSVFQYPYERVFKRAHEAFSKMGLRVTNADMAKGSIEMESNFSLSKSPLRYETSITEMADSNTKVTIKGILGRSYFFQELLNPEAKEIEIIETLSVYF